jgi:hypothetical protein
MDLPCRIPATNCETLARFSPQTAKPKPLRRNTPEAGVRYMLIGKTVSQAPDQMCWSLPNQGEWS